MRGYIICYIASQIPYLGKVWFPRSGQNALSQADCSVFKSTVSLEWNDEIAWFFLHVNRNTWKLKTDNKSVWDGHGEKWMCPL